MLVKHGPPIPSTTARAKRVTGGPSFHRTSTARGATEPSHTRHDDILSTAATLTWSNEFRQAFPENVVSGTTIRIPSVGATLSELEFPRIRGSAPIAAAIPTLRRNIIPVCADMGARFFQGVTVLGRERYLDMVVRRRFHARLAEKHYRTG